MLPEYNAWHPPNSPNQDNLKPAATQTDPAGSM